MSVKINPKATTGTEEFSPLGYYAASGLYDVYCGETKVLAAHAADEASDTVKVAAHCTIEVPPGYVALILPPDVSGTIEYQTEPRFVDGNEDLYVRMRNLTNAPINLTKASGTVIAKMAIVKRETLSIEYV